MAIDADLDPRGEDSMLSNRMILTRATSKPHVLHSQLHLQSPWDVRRRLMAGACDFNLVALGSLGIPSLQVGVDGSIFRRY